MAVRVPAGSRLRFAELLIDGDVEHWDMVELPNIPEQSDDRQHTVVATDTIEGLAFRYYRDAALWPVIAQANDIDLPPVGMALGRVLRIPSPRYVDQQLFTLALVT